MHLTAACPSLACCVQEIVQARAGTRTRWVGERCVVPRVFAEAILLRRKYAVMKDAARALPAPDSANTHSTLHNPKKGAA